MNAPTADGKLVKDRRRKGIRSSDVLILLFLGAMVLLLVNFRIGEIVEILYHPLAGLILVIMIIEFLWLKSGDRTRLYRLEIDRLRMQKRKDEALLERSRDIITQAVDYPDSEQQGRPGDWRQHAIDAASDITERL
ncbi:hypothetical protein BH09SUM1_BH09SUM1_31360 [soil metagenome]